MSRKLILPIVLSLLAVFIIGLLALTNYYTHLPERLAQHETIVLGQSRFTPGSSASLRVVVRDSRDASPLAGAQIQVMLQPEEGGRLLATYQGETGQDGSAEVAFSVPDDAPQKGTLVVETRSRLGSDRIERPVQIERDYRLLLATDKPVYQPGQVIHLRALALGAFDLRPAATQDVEFIISDGKGNKVFREKEIASNYGVASVDFQLASEVNTGPYKITATLGNTSSEKTVTVEHYVLPKFEVVMETERAYYLPGWHVKGTLKANYFFGKPVAGGQVTLEGSTFDVERTVHVNLQGATDADGNFEFEFDLPAYIAGSDLEGGLGRFYLQATVVDLAQHSEMKELSLPVANSNLVIEAIPEGGVLRPGVENILYVLTSYPDGSPAETELTLELYDTGQTIQSATGPYGLAEVRLTPQNPWVSMRVSARDARGNQSGREFSFEGDWTEESVLLRPERPVYRVGETMALTVLASKSEGSVYLDIVREGQTISTRSLEITTGRGEAAIDLTPDFYGTLELHAYKILASGAIVRDTRLVVVDRADDLNIAVKSTPPGGEGENLGDISNLTFTPGDTAAVDIEVYDQAGAGTQATLGLAVVDESVFALAEADPGFARLYFLLEKELLQPKYDLHGFSLPQLLEQPTVEDDGLRDAVENTAQASLAAAVPRGFNFSLNANSRIDNLRNATELQQKYFSVLAKGMYALALAVPLVILALAVLDLRRRQMLSGGLAIAFGLLLAVVILFIVWPLNEANSWAQTPVQRAGALISQLIGDQDEILALVLLAGFIGYLLLIPVAVKAKDGLLGWMLCLTPAYIAGLFLLFSAVSRLNSFPSGATSNLALLAYMLLPLAFLLRFGGFALEKKVLAAISALAVALFFAGGLLPAFAFGAQTVSRDLTLAAPPAMGNIEVMEEAQVIGGLAPIPTQVARLAMEAGAAPVEQEKAVAGDGSAMQGEGQEPPRLRQYFPETMLWLPDAVTDPAGRLRIDVPIADNITTWRVTALASTQDGRLGSADYGLRVFQDFFIDLDLPQALTVGDEVSIPVGVFNYLSESQVVRLELEPASWFELLDEPEKTLEIAANDINVVYFRVRAVDFGRQPFKVTAWGSRLSDAIQKEVRVFPDGKEFSFTHSDRLVPGQPVREVASVPDQTIAGTQRLQVKIYPGMLSQVVEGLDAILRMPFGCFEQTSSTTYPNVLVMDYLKTTGQTSPEVQMKAEEYINLGYQRLLTFEVDGGGFSLFGDAPADRMLTAYGLQEFADMSRVSEVDPDIIRRAAEWLLAQQNADGTWDNDAGLVHESTWQSLKDDRLPVTAYITWSLVEAGFAGDSRTQAGIAYVRERVADAEDPYVLALVANALVSADLESGQGVDASTVAVLDDLAALAKRDGTGAYWESSVATFMGSEGQTGSIETTALATLAFQQAEMHADLANAALTYLIRQKDSFGTWYSTQATVLSLKALLQSVRAGGENANATVTISLNGGQTRTLKVGAENFDVVQVVSFDDVLPGAENVVEISVEGEGNLMYQVTGGYYLPWEKLADYPELFPSEELVTIDLSYDRTELAVNDTVEVNVTVTLNEAGAKAESALIDLGLPPGFSVRSEDLDALVARFDDSLPDDPSPKIERYELTGRQILIYVSNLSAGQPLEFSYRLQARFPLAAQAPASTAYDYYNPGVNGEAEPLVIVVNP